MNLREIVSLCIAAAFAFLFVNGPELGAKQATICQAFFPVTRNKWPCQDFRSNLYIGRGTEWKGAPDFFMSLEDESSALSPLLRSGTPKLHVRSLVIADKGDSTDLIMRRAGRNNSKWNNSRTVAPTEPDSVIGTIYWQTWGGQDGGGNGWTALDGKNSRNGSIRTRACGNQTNTNRGGRMQFATASQGSTESTDRLEIGCDGRLHYNFPDKGWKVIAPDSNGILRAQ
jgi:hypothetical protein